MGLVTPYSHQQPRAACLSLTSSAVLLEQPISKHVKDGSSDILAKEGMNMWQSITGQSTVPTPSCLLEGKKLFLVQFLFLHAKHSLKWSQL